MAWTQWLGAMPVSGGTRFRVWAPKTQTLSVRVVGGPSLALQREADGYFTGVAPGVQAGARYVFRFPDGRERPDPASLLQPEGVHGPSEVVDLAAIAPRRKGPGVPLEKLIFCEIHLGTFTAEGTAEAAARHVPELAESLFTAVEVMPVAAFPGARGWGYDGVAPFAAHEAYGGPAGLARFVDAAHEAGLSAFLDVVYNHLGPEGNYLAEYGPYFTPKHKTPWGDALDFSLPPVRRFFLENALRWVSAEGGNFDGLRLDAVHSIFDDSPRHILREIAEAVHREGKLVIAESDENDPRLIEQHGLDAVWADDLHHALHVALTGESQGYYGDFRDPLPALAAALQRGWFYEGQYKPSFARKHGWPAPHLPARHFVVCAQNHDQIGNRARGERLTTLVGPEAARVAEAVVALQPALPLYFQGEEWGAREPFLYFVSHTDPALIEAVRKGRREEFKAFAWQGEVPDPESPETFQRSKLDRSRKDAAMLSWHRALLKLRREHPSLQDDDRRHVRASLQERVLIVHRGDVLLVASFAKGPWSVRLPDGDWQVLLDSAHAALQRGDLRGSGVQAVILGTPYAFRAKS